MLRRVLRATAALGTANGRAKRLAANAPAPVRAAVWIAVVGICLAACEQGHETPPPAAAAAPAAAAKAPSHPEPRKRPLPAFGGYTLEGKRFEVRDLLGRRALLFFFNPEVDDADDAARAVAELADERGDHNFQILGIAIGTDVRTAQTFVDRHGFEFPIVDDAGGEIATTLRLRQPLLFVGVDPAGDIAFSMPGSFPGAPDAAAVIEANLRESLRLPTASTELGAKRPLAPQFTADRMRGGERFDLAAERGRPIVLIFFLDTCPHCHDALNFLKTALPDIPEEKRPKLVGVSVRNRPYTVENALKEADLDFFDVVFDADYAIRDAYGVMAGVPDTFLIDREGRITKRFRGWSEARDPALMKMWLAQISGRPVPMLLHSTGFSGSDVCGVCHQGEHDTWQLTSHASAYDTLVRHGADQNDECVSCHVVGWNQPGGYRPGPTGQHLENVGCESCHGRGGPHLSPDFVSDGSYEAACRTCHDTKHSLGFEYATFVPQVSHAANAHLLELSAEERAALLAERGGARAELLPSRAAYVGSDACRGCHAAEFETWEKSAHANAVASLADKGESANAECLACHTTALGRDGGFPKGGTVAAHADLARVGCESCHGPGGDHVGADAARVGTILSLGDKCDSCVILQICGSCHDDANDPGFEFEVEAKIEAQRHGSFEPAASRPPNADQSAVGPSDAELWAHAFARFGPQ